MANRKKIASEAERRKQRHRTHENNVRKYTKLLKLFGESKIWQEKLRFSQNYLGIKKDEH